MNKLVLVIFDLDDTLIHSNIDYPLMKERVKSLFESNYSFTNNPTIKELLERLSSKPETLQRAQTIIDEMESGSAKIAQTIDSADKLPSILQGLQLQSAILTNNSRRSVDKYLTYNKFNFLRNMGPIITRNDVLAMKPDPAGLNKIIEIFNLQNKKSAVLYVGDSFIDADAAYNAGIRFVLINTRNLDMGSFNSKPWKVFSQLSEFIAFIQREAIDCIF